MPKKHLPVAGEAMPAAHNKPREKDTEACIKAMDDIHSETSNIATLLHLAGELTFDMDFTRPDGSRNDELDRLSALLWAISDKADSLRELAGSTYTLVHRTVKETQS